jgi:hypothetical protein
LKIFDCCCFKVLGIKLMEATHQWLTPVILATQEAEIRRIAVQSQPRQIVHETLSRKTLHKNRAGGVAQGEGPEFKPQYHKKKKKKKTHGKLIKTKSYLEFSQRLHG